VKFALPLAALGVLAVAGCAANKPTSALQPTPAVSQLAPAPAPIAEPAAETAAPDQSTAMDTSTPTPMTDTTPASSGSGGGQYTIKPGDTLYRIAVTHYGSGKQWKKIIAANPGLSPSHLRVGQTITLP
jgi:5'-nucleotidase / UDP-sugar diphosphatase